MNHQPGSRQNDLAQIYAERNLTLAILKQKTVLHPKIRVFKVCHLVYVFMPVANLDILPKLNSFWIVSWDDLKTLGATTYGEGIALGCLSNSYKPMIVGIIEITLECPSPH